MTTDALLSMTQVAERLHVSRQYVHKLIVSGRLPALLVGGQYILLESDLLAFQESRK